MPSAGKPIPHDAALGHVTGQAPYIDGVRPDGRRVVYVGFVGKPGRGGQVAERGYERSALPRFQASSDVIQSLMFPATICSVSS